MAFCICALCFSYLAFVSFTRSGHFLNGPIFKYVPGAFPETALVGNISSMFVGLYPIPAAIYVRNQAEPLDPINTKSLITAHSLRYMTDEEMLKQTWKDAREAVDAQNAFNSNKIALYISAATVVAIVAVGYMSYSTMGHMEEIKLILQGAGS